jgi:hypothetical protein
MTRYSFTAKTIAAAILISLLFVAGSAKAQVVMTIAGPLSAIPGGPDATFAGMITNTSLTDTYILSYGQIDSFALVPSSGAGDVYLSNLFFPTDPDLGSSLAPAPGASSTYGPGDLFSVSIDPAAPTGLYSGTFGLYGYSSSDLTQTPVELTSADFTLAVVPEASTTICLGLLLALGLGTMVFQARRRSRVA